MFRKWLVYLPEKWNYRSSIEQALKHLFLRKSPHFCAIDKHFLFGTYSMTKTFKNVVIQNLVSNKIDYFYYF